MHIMWNDSLFSKRSVFLHLRPEVKHRLSLFSWPENDSEREIDLIAVFMSTTILDIAILCVNSKINTKHTYLYFHMAVYVSFALSNP